MTAVAAQPATRLTVLNTMGDADVAASVARQRAWGLTDLDLKDGIFGARVADLDDAQAGRVAALARDHGMAIHCLSTDLCGDEVAQGEAAFRQRHLPRVARVIALARILRPRLVRLLAARCRATAGQRERFAATTVAHPWLVGVYAEAIARCADAGLATTIENEVDGGMLATADDVAAFFAALAAAGAGRERCGFTWDAQNLWQESGQPPSVATYRRLRPLITYVHLKGGRADAGSDVLRWRSGLDRASWPVAEVVRAVVADGRSPVICLNPSHGARAPGSADDHAADAVGRDLAWLRATVPGIA